MYVTQATRQAKSEQAVVLTLVTLLVGVGIWLVSRLLSR